jgi:hypothetical protein
MGMMRLGCSRGFGVGLALVLLAGCNGQSGTPGAMPQGIIPSGHVAHVGSWMKPRVSSSDLLYVASHNSGDIYVFTYPRGTLVGTLTGLNITGGLCSDKSGNVWINNRESVRKWISRGICPWRH